MTSRASASAPAAASRIADLACATGWPPRAAAKGALLGPRARSRRGRTARRACPTRCGSGSPLRAARGASCWPGARGNPSSSARSAGALVARDPPWSARARAPSPRPPVLARRPAAAPSRRPARSRRRRRRAAARSASRRSRLAGVPIQPRVVDAARLRAIALLEKLTEAKRERRDRRGVAAVLRRVDLARQQRDQLVACRPCARAPRRASAPPRAGSDPRRRSREGAARPARRRGPAPRPSSARARGAAGPVRPCPRRSRRPTPSKLGQLARVAQAPVHVDQRLPGLAVGRVRVPQSFVDLGGGEQLAQLLGRDPRGLELEAPGHVRLGDARGAPLQLDGPARGRPPIRGTSRARRAPRRGPPRSRPPSR